MSIDRPDSRKRRTKVETAEDLLQKLPAQMRQAFERPDHVWIGPHRFTIVYDQHFFLNLARSGASDRFGESNMGDMVIMVSDARSFTGMQETLLHEILHCLIWQAGMTIPENPEADQSEREEKLVGQLSGILLDCVKRNWHVFSWLQLEVE